jgi:hypothetical protein
MATQLFYACDNCWHAMSSSQVYEQGTGVCPQCKQGTMRELEQMNIPAPAVGARLLCLVCAYHKPWGIWDGATGVSVCLDCRDAGQHKSSTLDHTKDIPAAAG